MLKIHSRRLRDGEARNEWRATPALIFCDADILQTAGGQGIANAGFCHRSFQIVFEQESGSPTKVGRVIEMMLIDVRET